MILQFARDEEIALIKFAYTSSREVGSGKFGHSNLIFLPVCTILNLISVMLVHVESLTCETICIKCSHFIKQRK